MPEFDVRQLENIKSRFRPVVGEGPQAGMMSGSFYQGANGSWIGKDSKVITVATAAHVIDLLQNAGISHAKIIRENEGRTDLSSAKTESLSITAEDFQLFSCYLDRKITELKKASNTGRG